MYFVVLVVHFFSLGEDFLPCIGNPSVVFIFLFILNLSSDPYGF